MSKSNPDVEFFISKSSNDPEVLVGGGINVNNRFTLELMRCLSPKFEEAKSEFDHEHELSGDVSDLTSVSILEVPSVGMKIIETFKSAQKEAEDETEEAKIEAEEFVENAMIGLIDLFSKYVDNTFLNGGQLISESHHVTEHFGGRTNLTSISVKPFQSSPLAIKGLVVCLYYQVTKHHDPSSPRSPIYIQITDTVLSDIYDTASDDGPEPLSVFESKDDVLESLSKVVRIKRLLYESRRGYSIDDLVEHISHLRGQSEHYLPSVSFLNLAWNEKNLKATLERDLHEDTNDGLHMLSRLLVLLKFYTDGGEPIYKVDRHSGEYTLNFGKYKNMKLKDVPPRYITYLHNNVKEPKLFQKDIMVKVHEYYRLLNPSKKKK